MKQGSDAQQFGTPRSVRRYWHTRSVQSDIAALIGEIRADDEEAALRAYSRLWAEAADDPAAVLPELCRAVAAEPADGLRPVLRLLIIVAAVGCDDPGCLEAARTVLRGPADGVISVVGVAAGVIVARAEPQSLVPDPDSILTTPSELSSGVDVSIARSVPYLLAASAQLLERDGEDEVTALVRGLWHDCAAHDLMALADFVANWVELVDGAVPVGGIVDLLVDLATQVGATADAKRYVGRVLADVGIGGEALDRMGRVWRAAAVAEGVGRGLSLGEAPLAADAAATDPLVDELLVQFADGDEMGIELARIRLEALLDERATSAVGYWLAATIDALDDRRRHDEIGWILLRAISTRAALPAGFLRRWLDAPALLNEREATMALIILSRSEPAAVAADYLERAIAVSNVRHASIVVGDLWRAMTHAAPGVVLQVACRWSALGLDESDFSELVEGVISEVAASDSELAAGLCAELQSVTAVPAGLAARIRTAAGEELRP